MRVIRRPESGVDESLGHRVSRAEPSADDQHADRRDTSAAQSKRRRLGVGSSRPHIINHQHMATDEAFREFDRELVDSNRAITAWVGTGHKYGIDDHSNLFDDRRQWMNTRPACDGRESPDGDRQAGYSANAPIVQRNPKSQYLSDQCRRVLPPRADRMVLIGAERPCRISAADGIR